MNGRGQDWRGVGVGGGNRGVEEGHGVEDKLLLEHRMLSKVECDEAEDEKEVRYQ